MAEVDIALKTDVAVGAYRNSSLLFGNFVLRDGSWSPYYMDVRPVPSISEDPDRTDMSRADQLAFRRSVVDTYSTLLDQLGEYDHIMAIPEAVNHLVGMIGFPRDDSVLYRRSKTKDHGLGSEGVLGHYRPGDVVTLVDDLITTSGAKVEEKERLEDITKKRDSEGNVIAEGVVVNDTAVMLDRESGGIENARKAGLTVVAGITLTEFIEIPHDEGVMVDEAYAIIKGFRNKEITRPEDISPTWADLGSQIPYTPYQLFRRIA